MSCTQLCTSGRFKDVLPESSCDAISIAYMEARQARQDQLPPGRQLLRAEQRDTFARGRWRSWNLLMQPADLDKKRQVLEASISDEKVALDGAKREAATRVAIHSARFG
ncbi:unnamed protein product [Prorocentrum cordatum]|uniref:Uncharacterized protein n=1 Tax=Prorocentrum cordatum TaxID=2364126 RepID=A0ABN9Y9U0_9DINO|nr:unnamed protein product [Polarella glacialis]